MSSVPATAPSRRTVIKYAGLAAAIVAGLSACTVYGSGGTPSSPHPTAGAPSRSPSTGTTSRVS